MVTDATTSSLLLLTTPNDTPGRRAPPTLFRFQTPGKAGRTTISAASARPMGPPSQQICSRFAPRLCPSRECFASWASGSFVIVGLCLGYRPGLPKVPACHDELP